MKSKKTKTQLLWIGLGTITILIRIIIGKKPEVIEEWYSRGLFPILRLVIDYTVALLPFPLIILFIAFVIFKLIKGIRSLGQKSIPLPQRLKSGILGFLSFFGGLAFFFLLLWGFNYARVPIEDQLELNIVPLTYDELMEELEKETEILIRLRAKISSDTTALTIADLPDDLESKSRDDVKKTMESLGYPSTGVVQARMLRPKGIILRISTSGFYFPWTGESHLDAGLHPIQLPSVMAHELAHGYGITDEGSCNFIAYLACQNSNDPFFQYAGHFGYWRYLRGSLYTQNPEAFEEYIAQLPNTLNNDLTAIRKQMDLYPDILPKIRNLTYETYLKTQGISEGIANYRRIILLVHAWERKGLNL